MCDIIKQRSSKLYDWIEKLDYLVLKRITFEISDEAHHRLKLLCYTEGTSQGEVLRECVKKYCDDHDAHLIEIIDKRKNK